MTELKDRRKEPRKIVMAFTPVRASKQGKLLGYLRDLTLQGALIIGEKTLEVESQTTLVIKLPDDLPGITAKNLTVSARVARCVNDEESPNYYKTGFEFIDIQPEQKKIIEALIKRF